jgi:hypothetical protein
MATPAQLMETISIATGVPLATVVDIDRKLAKVGLRNKGGRGFSAARMTPKDAAHLLIAMLAAPQSNEAALAVERYADTSVDKKRSDEGLYSIGDLGDLAGLPARHGFITGLSGVIASAVAGALFRLQRGADGGWPPKIEVFALAHETRGGIRISGLPSQQTVSVEYLPMIGADSSPINSAGDLEQSRRITERTIFSVAELLRQEDGRERELKRGAEGNRLPHVVASSFADLPL